MGCSSSNNTDKLDEIVIPNELSAVRRPEQMILRRLEDFDYSDNAIFAVRLAFAEAVNNAVKHGNAGDPDKKIRVGIAVNEKRVILEVEDEGSGFEPQSVPDPTQPDRIGLPNGRGIMLIRAYMTDVEYNERGNRIRMTKVKE